ncbi:MAG TPA: HAD family phosphatase [Solirubrobacteraceae bacterium]|nr:HAD family phosphatase [Solirubrobacteraceae bacterium]
MRLEAVVFDNDGLLLDTEGAWTRAEVALFAANGREFTAFHKRELLGSSPQAAAVKLEALLDAPGRGIELMHELGVLAYEQMKVGVEPRPGALNLLEWLVEAEMPFAVASNSSRRMVERGLETAGVDPNLFTTILTADVVTEPKPAPEMYLAACTALGSEPARTLVLEDSPTGVAAGVAAGCYTVAVPSTDGVDLSAAALIVASLDAPELRRLLDR